MRLTKFLFKLVIFLVSSISFAQNTTKVTKPLEPWLDISVTTDEYVRGGHHAVTLTGTMTLDDYIQQSLGRLKNGMLITAVTSTTTTTIVSGTFRLQDLVISSGSATYTLTSMGGKFYDGVDPVDAVYAIGNVGITTTTPTVNLDVFGEARILGEGLLITDSSSVGNTITATGTSVIDDLDWAVSSGAGYIYLNWLSDGSSSRAAGSEVVFADNGSMGLGVTSPTVRLDVNGNVRANNVMLPSDLRYKTEVETISNALETLLKLRGVKHGWIKEPSDDGRRFPEGKTLGVIAQELEQYVPELVATDQNGYKTVDYTKLTALLIEALKEQQTAIEAQESRMDAIEERLNRLENK